MIQEGFCISCGRRLEADPDRPNDGREHEDCKRHSFPRILRNLGVSPVELKKVLEGQGILTTNKYWDCECKENYIHPKSQEACVKCCTKASEQPDSRISEVLSEVFLLEEEYHSDSNSNSCSE